MRPFRRRASACSGCDNVSHSPDRQSRRDRLPHRPHRATHGHRDGRRLFSSRCRCAACEGRRSSRPDRTGGRARQLPQHRPHHRSGAARRCGCHSSRLWLSVGEPGVRRSLREGGHRLRRSAAVGDARHGLEIGRQVTHGTIGRAAAAWLSRRAAGSRVSRRSSSAHRLPADDQGGVRRRGARHADRVRMPTNSPRPWIRRGRKRHQLSATTECCSNAI